MKQSRFNAFINRMGKAMGFMPYTLFEAVLTGSIIHIDKVVHNMMNGDDPDPDGINDYDVSNLTCIRLLQC